MTPNTGRRRAQRRFPALGTCAECEVAPARDRHHWDGNTFNNAPTNVVPLCRRCHQRIDGRLDLFARYRYVPTRAPMTACIDCGAMHRQTRKGRCHKCDARHRRRTARAEYPLS